MHESLICQGDNEVRWKRDHLSNGPVKLDCPADWYAKDFHFDLAYYHCQTRYGKSAQTCSELDAQKVIARTQDHELIQRMTNFTKTKFEEYKEKLASQCCGTKSTCLQRFSSTQLVISDRSEISASYLSDSSPTGRNIVEITERKMASTMNQESLERVILVELAHSCQFALVSESKDKYRTFTTNPCSIEAGKQMFIEGLGEEMGSCLDQELKAQISAIPESEKGKYCFGKWYREAFSDMKFRSEFKSIYHWTYDFLRRSQHKNYGSVYKYIKCGVTTSLKEQVCKNP